MANGTAQPRVVVSVTPLALEADSRTFRIAHALSEAGFRSIVVEGRTSRRRFWDDAIDVRSLAPPRARSNQSPSPRGGGLRSGRLGHCGELALYAAFRGHDLWRHCLQPLAKIPKADLYYLHSFEFHRVVAAAGGRQAPIIYDAHDFYRGIEPPERQPSFDGNYLRPFCNGLEARLAAAAAAIVTVSRGVADLMERTFGRRPIVVRNCHDERLDDSNAPDLRAVLSLAPGDRLCIVVGNRKPGMAVETALQALALLPNHVHLAFLGRGYDADRERARNGPLARRVHFGYCPSPDQVVPTIRSANLGLVLYEPYSENYRHALPNGFFQVIAAGLPVVRGALPEIEMTVGGRQVGACVEHLGAAGLAQAITQCFGNLVSLRAGAANLAAELRWEREAIRLHRIVEDVLAGAAPLSAAGDDTWHSKLAGGQRG